MHVQVTKGGAPQCLHPCPQQLHPSCPAFRPVLLHACSTGASGPPVSCHARAIRSMCRAAHTAGLHQQFQKSLSLQKQWRFSATMPAALHCRDRNSRKLDHMLAPQPGEVLRRHVVLLQAVLCATQLLLQACTSNKICQPLSIVIGMFLHPCQQPGLHSLSFKPASSAACALSRHMMSYGIMPCLRKLSQRPRSPYCRHLPAVSDVALSA